METFNGLPLLKIHLRDDEDGVGKISLVDNPAIEVNWLAFGKVVDEELKTMFAEISNRKLAGPLMIPDLPILREHPKTKERFYVTFPIEVVAQIAERFNKNLFGAKWNTQHETDVDGVYVAENWIIDSPESDKSNKYGHVMKIGTWYGIVKVENETVWNDEVVTGKLRGFSVEMVSGLSLSIQSAIEDHGFENHVDEVLSKIEGETISDNWKHVASYDIDENEESLTEIEALNLAIQSDANKESSLDVDDGNRGQWRVRYTYEGPRDGKNRTFCRKLLEFQGTTKVFRKEDINQMSFTSSNADFGTYSIFRYKGSYGCRHKWRRAIFFVDYEDKEIRRVGNVPKVTKNLNDKEATRVNLNKTENMAQKFATITELPTDERVVGASVDNADGEFEVDGIKYIVADGVITEVMDAVVESEVSTEMAGEIDQEALTKFMEDVLVWMAEKDAQIEAIVSKANGTDNTSSEEFKSLAGNVEKLQVLLKLLPSDNSASNGVTVPVAATFATALQKIKEQSKRN